MNKLILALSFLVISCCTIAQPLPSRQRVLLDSLTLLASGNDYTNIHSILISQNGQLVYEKYINNWNKDSLHDLRSSFKSITSLLTGIAVDKGLIKDVKQKAYSFFPAYKINDARKKISPSKTSCKCNQDSIARNSTTARIARTR